MVLAAHSLYFHTVIDQAMKKKNQDMPVISVDCDIASISNLLQYMYTGNVSVNRSGIEELCRQAEKYCMRRLFELCTKLKHIMEVKPEAADKTRDSSSKHEDSVPMRWEYNSQETLQHTSSLYHSEIGCPTSDISDSEDTMQDVSRVVLGAPVSNISQSEDTMQDVSRVVLGAPVSNISQSEDTMQGVSRVVQGAPVSNISQSEDTMQDVSRVVQGAPVSNISQSEDTMQDVSRVVLGAPVSNISQSGDTMQGVSRVVQGAPVSNISQSRHTVQEVSRVDLGIVKQEMTDSPNDDTEYDRSSKSTLPCNTIKSMTPPLFRNHVTLPENIELDRDRLERKVIKKEVKSDDEEEMVCDELMDSNPRHDSGSENSAKRGQQSYDSPSVYKRIKTASNPVTLKLEDV